MKKLIITTLLFIGLTVFSQQNPNKSNPNNTSFHTSSPQQKNEKQVQKMVKELNLDSNQEQQLRVLYRDRQTTNNETLTPKERKEFNKKLKSILTTDQMALLKSKRK